MTKRKPAGLEWFKLVRFQHGVVSHAQLRGIGVSPDFIRWQLISGRWRRIHLGVYATFTGPLPREAELWAAVLRAGPGAMLSHETAAEVHEFASEPSKKIHITVPAGRHPARHANLHGIVIHRSDISAADRQPPWHLPRTAREDTVLDLIAAAETDDDAYGWLSRAVARQFTVPELLLAALKNRKKMPRRDWLVMALEDAEDGIQFPLERRWVRAVERPHGFPRATRQLKRKHEGGTRYLDNVYAKFGVCVELDGQIAHPEEGRYRDRQRDNENLARHDTKTLRYGFRDVANHPCEPAVQLALTLIRHKWAAKTLKPCGPACPVGAIVRKLRSGELRPGAASQR